MPSIMNICEHLSSTARIFPDKVAIRFEGASITYSQLDDRSQVAAAEIRAKGIHSGDRVALMLANVPAFAVWYFAAARAGAIVVSISTRSAPAEVDYFVNDCGATLFVCDESQSTLLADVKRDVQVMTTNDDGQSAASASMSDDGTKRVSTVFCAGANDAAAILYTSGTTGFAKGATLSHGNIRSNVCAFNHLCNQRSEDRILLAVPLFHCFGQNALLNSALNVGATLVLQRKFDLNETRRLIAEEGVTQLYGVPMMFQLLLDSCEPSELSTVNYCFSAAATLPVQTAERWQQKFGLPIHEGYGLTETSPFASYNHRNKFVGGSIGTPIDNVEMKVVSTETGQDCLPDQLGEIVIKGPNVMLGYWNRKEETAAAIQDGWFRSGDIGRMDAAGYFSIVDRVKDMIAVGGLKVFPAEVERVLLDHPSVQQCAVVGLLDEVFGEQVVAFVVLDSSQSHNDSEDHPAQQDIAAYAKANLANYKVPRTIIPIDELPRNASGKILKRELREYNVRDIEPIGSDREEALRFVRAPTLRTLLDQSHASTRIHVATEFVQNLVQCIADLDELPAGETRFLDAGLDSLMIVEVSNQLQAEVGPENPIPATLVFDYPCLCDLAEYLVNTLFPADQSSKAEASVAEPIRPNPKDNLRRNIESLSEAEALAELMKELD